MNPLRRDEIEATLTLATEHGELRGRMGLAVPCYGRSFPVEIWLAEGHAAISDKTVATLNDLATLPPSAREGIRAMLYQDALRARSEVEFGDPAASTPAASPGFLAGLFKRRSPFHFVPLAADDPRHPCYFENGVGDVEQKVEWVGVRINEIENGCVEGRFALLDCLPAWEAEHGVTVVIRNGEPVGLGHYDVDVRKYEGSYA
ncbi:hypothetical protein HI806_01910 [Ralstonia solanacearum]|uniref:hypothetical protein n=2 Tax=Ralstonia pseudosolanacearum TaxID=1310165 RepID=UPI000A97304D|nr:hypothetical protein [Ralstonia pseudosolanacearum]QKL70118.1 hypothetical protein HI806_01910 [Ralstonia solanacearum]MDO3620781.1 hypothetical protein [Ralstonia pseudosolanacearum]QKL75331.1 hypothetical protein HI805_01910 [Ralstonia solanacearum]QKL80532.1 hypothetical protein HI804_01915 [Ralstonia solanacearum]QKL85745.1 hypothetical protein HI803_01915 [Ralstonia solanacearum]